NIPSTWTKKAGSGDFQPFLSSSKRSFLKNGRIRRIYKVEDTSHERHNESSFTHGWCQSLLLL
ncbi:hypothetical protein, partial [Faecalibaculum rodentium]|uniref:hypothetical protein n=1 Tax=Faecalibaculum rodentium TaxID=1702221 RepID=UPI0025A99BDF